MIVERSLADVRTLSVPYNTSGDVDVDEFCTWLGDGEGEYDKNKVSSVPNVELVAAADGGYTIPDIKRVLRFVEMGLASHRQATLVHRL